MPSFRSTDDKKELCSASTSLGGVGGGNVQVHQPYEGTNSLLYCAKNSCADLDAFQNGVIADRMKTEATVTKPKLMGTKSGEVEVLKDRSQANTICDYSGPSFYDGCGGNPSSTSSRPSAAHCASLGR